MLHAAANGFAILQKLEDNPIFFSNLLCSLPLLSKLQREVLHVGSDINIPKFGLNIFREILEKTSKYLQKFSKYLQKVSNYLKIFRKFRILMRWRIHVSKPQRRQRLSWHAIWRMQYHVNARAGRKLIIDAKSVTHW